MREIDDRQDGLFGYVSLDAQIPSTHPLRAGPRMGCPAHAAVRHGIVMDGEALRVPPVSRPSAAASGVGPIPWPASLEPLRVSLGALSYRITAMQYGSGRPEGENLRQGSADEPFNWEISA
jgi:hypothetical protein